MGRIRVIYRAEVWNGKQHPEVHELEIGLGFRGRKEKEYRYLLYIGLNSTVRKRWIVMSINTQPQAASLQWDGSGEGSGTEL